MPMRRGCTGCGKSLHGTKEAPGTSAAILDGKVYHYACAQALWGKERRAADEEPTEPGSRRASSVPTVDVKAKEALRSALLDSSYGGGEDT